MDKGEHVGGLGNGGASSPATYLRMVRLNGSWRLLGVVSYTEIIYTIANPIIRVYELYPSAAEGEMYAMYSKGADEYEVRRC